VKKSRETSLKSSYRDSNRTRFEYKSEALPHEPVCVKLGSFRVLERVRNLMKSQRLFRALYRGVKSSWNSCWARLRYVTSLLNTCLFGTFAQKTYLRDTCSPMRTYWSSGGLQRPR